MKDADNVRPVVMTIAGFDPSGAAGILADSRTIIALGCYPVAVTTAITFQNAEGVSGFVAHDSDNLRRQLLPIFNGFKVSAIKTGMMPTREIVREVGRILVEHPVSAVVIDPVMKSSSGYSLMSDDAVIELRKSPLLLGSIVTPNIPEAERLVGFSISDEKGMRRAAESIRALGVKAVLIKGGHLNAAPEIFDLLDENGEVTVFHSERIENGEFRGTGCALASGIAASLAQGHSLKEAVRRAREFVLGAMREAVSIGGRRILFRTR